ncbi:MAG: hypothetical protein DWQ02_07620 [Bacteroidetes bacterium]|nr:MAG: hypothetical protein DWQ02_07620 [Bacteroidota bacterium]
MKLPIFLALILLAIGCTELTTEIPDKGTIKPPVFNDNPIMYCGMEIGQKSTYVLLEGQEYFNNQSYDNFAYLNDTLVVEIIDQDENGFLIEEYFTPGSDPLPGNFYYMEDSVYQYYLKAELDTIYFFDPDSQYGMTSLLFWHMDGQLPLSNFTNQEADIIGWKTSISYCECDQTAYDPEYELFGTIYEDLNISIQNAIMAVDGPGTTFVYSNLHGMVRTSHYSWWTQTGFGWDLLGQE